MSTKERLERELAQLQKTHKSGIIKKDEYEKARTKVEEKLAEHIEISKKDDESKQIISDILDGRDKVYETEEVLSPKSIAVGKETMAKEEKMDYGSYEEPEYEKEEATVAEITSDDEPQNKPKKGKKDKIKRDRKDEKKAIEKHISEKDDKIEEDEEKNTGIKFLYISLVLIILIGSVLFLVMTNNNVPTKVQKIEKNLTTAKGVVNIDFYYSYSCSPCYKAFIMLEGIKATYGDYVNVTYRHFPLDLEQDTIMDNAAECAKAEGTFISYSKKLFAIKKPIAKESLVLLQYSGLNNTSAFKECVNSMAKMENIAAEYKSSLGAVDSLPSIVVEGTIITGDKPFSVYETIIDDALGLR
jgi:predicted DsbA family dithiol-disulfide isomerase